MTSDAAGNVYLAAQGPTGVAGTADVAHWVYQSTDKGMTWTDVSPTTINILVPGLTTNKVGKLFAATAGAGVWQR